MRLSFEVVGALAVLTAVTHCSIVKGQNVTVFRQVNVVPMTEETILKDYDVIVRGSRIADIGPSGKVDVPEDANIIDGAGAYLMPGLADMHVHLNDDWHVDHLSLYLANGVTTIRDMHGSELLAPWRREVESGTRPGPALCGTAPIIYGWEKRILPSGRVNENWEAGHRAQKLLSHLTEKDFPLVMRQLKKRGMYSVGHIPLPVGLDSVIKYGMDEIAHIEELGWEIAMTGMDRTDPRLLRSETAFQFVFECFARRVCAVSELEEFRRVVQPEVVEIARKVREARITVCTTLSITELIGQKMLEPEKVWARSYAEYFPRELRAMVESGEDRNLVQLKGHERCAGRLWDLFKMIFVELHRAGVFMVLGTDSGLKDIGSVPGFQMHDELRLVTELGLSPYEAIGLCTKNAARIAVKMSEKGDFGTVEVGKRADLILVHKNPLDNIANIADLRGVMAAGKWYPQRQLAQMIALDE